MYCVRLWLQVGHKDYVTTLAWMPAGLREDLPEGGLVSGKRFIVMYVTSFTIPLLEIAALVAQIDSIV